MVMVMAFAQAHAGNHDEAIDLLEDLQGIPSGFTGHYLRIEPLLKPLHGDPRFEALVNREIVVF